MLETSAELIAEKVPSVDANQIYNALIAREQLGSTGLGNGIAIPHCRVPKCESTIGCLIKLEKGLDFDAIDGEPVDLLFYLLVPENTIEGQLIAKLIKILETTSTRSRIIRVASIHPTWSRR